MSTRKSELTRQAARLFAEKGYHGTSIGDLAEAMGVQKGSLYAHIESKAGLLWEVARDGAAAFHAALDGIPDELKATEKIRRALRAHLRVVAEQVAVRHDLVHELRVSLRVATDLAEDRLHVMRRQHLQHALCVRRVRTVVERQRNRARRFPSAPDPGCHSRRWPGDRFHGTVRG